MSEGPPKALPPVPMVNWFDAEQLGRTGLNVMISNIFRRYADQRILQALAAAEGVADYTRDGEFWFDFVADVGDGSNSAYAVAYAMRLLQLRLCWNDRPEITQRGELLVFGGDLVYPTADPAGYERRLVTPYRAAFGEGPYPPTFAVPGDHDWFDNLLSFSRLFFSRQLFAGPLPVPGQPARGCETPQRRSYFAMKLPHGWWLLGLDVLPGSDIDGPQYDYFSQVIDDIKQTNGSVIVCTHAPHWVYAETAPAKPRASGQMAVGAIEDLLGDRIRVYLAGDVHHYCRYESRDGRTQKITAGGGGAFQHPTHGVAAPARLKGGEFERAKGGLYPTPGRSWWQSLRLIPFFIWNPRFGILTAALYVLVLWTLMPFLADFPIGGVYGLYKTTPAKYDPDPKHPEIYGFGDVWCHLVADPGTHPDASMYLHQRIAAIVLMFLVAMGFVLFTDWEEVPKIAGFAHGLTHCFLALLFAWLAAVVCWKYLTDPNAFNPKDSGFWNIRRFYVATVFAAVTGWFVGSVTFGVYLLLMISLLGRHWNAAFSALKIEDWKHFLRLKIAADGTLTIYPIGIDRVPRKWDDAPKGPDGHVAGPLVVPKKGQPFDPKLIEGPIVLPAPAPVPAPAIEL